MKVAEFTKLAALLIPVILLSGCAATPVGKIPESDFVWQEKNTVTEYQKVYRNLVNGFKTCTHSAIEPIIYTDTKEAHIDVYIRNVYSPTKFVLGVINVKALNDSSTNVRVGVQSIYDKPVFGEEGVKRKKWMSFVDGNTNCDD